MDTWLNTATCMFVKTGMLYTLVLKHVLFLPALFVTTTTVFKKNKKHMTHSGAISVNTEFRNKNLIHGANMGPTWVLVAQGGPHVGSINLAIRAEKLKEKHV